MIASGAGASSSGGAASHGAPGHRAGLAAMVGAIGVVYGDIGTSPLYAIKECFSPESPHRLAVSAANVLGVLSLVFWALTMVIVLKYLTFIMRADNHGAGGILALLALVPAKLGRGRTLAVGAALAGTALLYGDGVITPAISVLSAVEGLAVAAPSLSPLVVPLTLAVLVALFAVQRHGTGGIGKVFGPLTLVWFATLAVLGARELAAHPAVLAAIDPRYAVRFFAAERSAGFLTLGAVFLVVTGGEALYADMGHFGRVPIRRAWFAVVFPALLLNYFGQGAALLSRPEAVANPFYALVPSSAVYYVLVISTCATVVASQALISGVFSLTQQAVQLGYFPRVTVVHTSREEAGQVYVPEVNNLLFVACVACVVMFKSSSALAAAYGIAVTGTMGITTLLYFVVATRTWGWSASRAVPLVAVFLVFDLAFFGANAAKIAQGGWFPLAVGGALLLVMTTWHRGRALLWAAIEPTLLPLDAFVAEIEMAKPHRVKGTAVFMSSNPAGTPPALLHNLKHNQVLHDRIVLLAVLSLPVPDVRAEDRVSVELLAPDCYQVTARFGFMETPDVPLALRLCEPLGLHVDPQRASFYLGRETLVVTDAPTMRRWRKRLFAFLSKNARAATEYFRLPPGRVVELGAQIPL